MRVVRPRGILVRVRTPSGGEWDEAFCKRTDSARRWAEETIAEFNASLRPGEEPREILRIEELPLEDERIPPLRHDFRKTNLVTVMNKRGHGSHDAYRCRDCGATGKRFTLGGDVILDKARLRGKPCPGDGVLYAVRRRR